jgi:hypothetical protein
MRSNLLALVIILSLAPGAMAQDWGVGILLGDPSGLSVKKYNGEHAWEFSLGRTHLFSNSRYYNNSYNNWYNHQDFGYRDHELLNYRSTVPIGLQVHYLIHRQIKDAGGLSWYYGVGAQLRVQRLEYDYRYKVEGGPDWVVVNNTSVTETDLGLDGVIGLEYRFADAPVALFVDATLFMELFNDPFVFDGQGGLGVRYTF